MKRSPIVLYPFFFAVYAILGAYSQNIGSVPIARITRPLLVLLIITIVLYLLLKYLTGDTQRAGFLTTLILAWLFFGHLYRLLLSFLNLSPSTFIDLTLLATWSAILFILGSRKVWEKIRIPEVLTNFLNVTSWILLVLPLYLTISSYIQFIHQNALVREKQKESAFQLEQVNSIHPDIYVIILDAYGRTDFIQKAFHYDNSNFIKFLKEKGFYVAEQSRPNYPQTVLSLASLLNINYLDKWTAEMGGSNNRVPLDGMIVNSNTRVALEGLGYKFITTSDFEQYCEDKSNEQNSILKIGFNPFEELTISTTSLDLFIRAWNLNLPVASYEGRRHHITQSLEFLKCIALAAGPKFVYVHILAPHPPFVFNENGQPIQPDYPYTPADGEAYPGTVKKYATGYSNELTYLNQEMESVITTILEKSQKPPVIILQGDHGSGDYFTILGLETEPCLQERFSILNAYYFPDRNYNLLYPSITPVNSFRVVFDTYFGASLPLLEDRNYYATYASPYKFTDITEQASNCSIDFSQ